MNVDHDAFLQAVGECGCGGLVDQALDLDPGKLAGGARRLALRVAEIRRNADHRLADVLAQRGLGVRDQRAQDQRR